MQRTYAARSRKVDGSNKLQKYLEESSNALHRKQRGSEHQQATMENILANCSQGNQTKKKLEEKEEKTKT